MNKQLASTVLDTFQLPDCTAHSRCLKRFSFSAWQKTLHWLDASGLALYLLRELKAQGMEDALPTSILRQLERRKRENAERTQFLFEEFARINAAFRSSGLRYVNLKGFTLAPDYCPDLSLRYQTDLDFLMNRSDAERCHGILKEIGYGIVAANKQVIEFKTDVGKTPRIADLYKIRPERSVEIHLCDPQRADRHPELLNRSRRLQLDGCDFPALSVEDMFFSQAHHLFRHLCSEWTRISWLLELRRFVVKHAEDKSLWNAVHRLADRSPGSGLALALALHFTRTVLGIFATQDLTDWSARQLPPAVALWVDRYARKVALTDFPGSKRYLILESALGENRSPAEIRRRLFPTRVPGPIVVATKTGSVQHLQAFVSRSVYFCFRLRFHVKTTLQYSLESWLWNRDRKVRPRAARRPATYSAGTVD